MRCVAGCLVLLLSVIVAGCGRGERIARSPVESKSRYCKNDRSLYRVGSVLFCADPETRWAARFIYSVTGSGAATFDRQVRQVISVAHCLTARTFEQVADGQFKITIDDKTDPPKNGRTRHGRSYQTTYLDVAGIRTGSAKVSTTNGTPDYVGHVVEAGMWKFLGLSHLQPTAIASIVPAIHASSASPREIPDGASSCKAKSVLLQTDGISFCAPGGHYWPRSTGYAVVGDTAGFEPAIVRSAEILGRLTRVRFEASSRPNLLVVLSEREVTDDALAALLQARHVAPKEGVLHSDLAVGRSMGSSLKNGLGQVVGKPVASALANFMSTSSSGYSVGGDDPTGASLLGLHNRSRADTESQIQESFLKLLEMRLPTYHLPESCEGAANAASKS